MLELPDTQVLRSTTFSRPPLQDGTHTLPQLYDWQAEHSPHHPFCVFTQGAAELRTISWSEACRGIHRASLRIISQVQHGACRQTGAPVLAILAASDTITYFCHILGALRGGLVVFPISPRNSAQAIAHLLQKTGAAYLCVSQEPAIGALARGAAEILSRECGDAEVPVLPMPIFEELFPAQDEPCSIVGIHAHALDMNAPAFILHSSGSTDFPKPMLRTHRQLVELSYIPWFGEVDICGLLMGCHSMPMFHAMGVLQLALLPSCGVVMSVFKPASPATMPTPMNVFEGTVTTRSDLVCCVPTFIEEWSRDPEKVAAMRKMKGVMYGGGPLNKQVGDYLASEGVRLVVNYGCTECGVLSSFIPENPGANWDFFRIGGQCRPQLLPYDGGIFELALAKHTLQTPCQLNTKVEGNDAYATKDLLEAHPSIPGMWRIYGRADDQIMLSTGEKTNATPLEAMLRQDPHVEAAVIFGRGQFQNGVLIQPKADFVFDPRDEPRLIQFRNLIWPSVERMNAFAPTHSRIFKEMILAADPSKPFEFTAKGGVRRRAVTDRYASEIEALYRAVADSAEQGVPSPKEWSRSGSLDFVRHIVHKVMMLSVEDDADLFSHGCDSLQATWIRNSILSALRSTAGSSMTKVLSHAFVYENPSIIRLASVLSSGADPSSSNEFDLDGKTEMQAMVDRYSSNFPIRAQDAAVSATDDGDVVLLTGTTGGFGASMLCHFLALGSVRKIYALNRRGSGQSLWDRQVAALASRGLEVDHKLLASVVLLEVDLTRPDLGLDNATLHEMQACVTHIIHNAWRVNFNLSLTSFEENVSGLRHLVDFALASPRAQPPRLIFISSVGVFRNFSGPGLAPEAPIIDAKTALGTGYSESKWVAEQILCNARSATNLRPIIIRLGQVTGFPNGSWNENEWFPALVKSALSLNSLPNIPSEASWIRPVDAARVVADIRNADAFVLHLAHPQPVPASSIMEKVANTLNVELVPYERWLSSLQRSLDDASESEVDLMRRNPALRLVDFFRHADLDGQKEFPGLTRLAMEDVVRASPTLQAGLTELGAGDVQAWLAAWRTSGFIPTQTVIERPQKYRWITPLYNMYVYILGRLR